MTPHISQYFATRPRRLTAIFIAANFALFAAMLAVMFYLRWASEMWPTPFHFPSMLMAAALTSFGICASVCIAVGERAAKLNDVEPAVRWIAIAISCWFVFLFLEVVEWVHLVYIERLGPGTSFGGSFLLLTGSHWVAATACMGWFAYVAADVRRRDILAAALYSHFLNLWWIVLVITLYLSNADIQGI
jgi:heme/copper-type cytochrome/quinol oxidase subunit 3